MSGGRPWTTGEQHSLFDMRARKCRTAEIALALGRTEQAIYSFLRYVPATATSKPRMKHIEPKLLEWTHPEIAVMRRFIAEGLSPADVAEALGRPVSAVATKASREKMRFRQTLCEPRPGPASKRPDWRNDARAATACLLSAIERAGLRP